MQTKKGVTSRYSTLLARDVLQLQTAHMRKKFELAQASMVAEKAASLTNPALNIVECRGMGNKAKRHAP